MSNTSILVRSLIGPGQEHILGFVACIDETGKLMFEQDIPMIDISVMKDVYSQVAKLFGMKIGTVSKKCRTYDQTLLGNQLSRKS